MEPDNRIRLSFPWASWPQEYKKHFMLIMSSYYVKFFIDLFQQTLDTIAPGSRSSQCASKDEEKNIFERKDLKSHT